MDYEKSDYPYPVLGDPDLPEGFSRLDYRDPKMFQYDDGTYASVIVPVGQDLSLREPYST